MIKVLTGATLLFTLATGVALATDQPISVPPASVAEGHHCPPVKVVLDYLFKEAGEIPAAEGKSLSTPSVDTLLTANETTGTWSALAMLPDGTACLMIRGGGLVLRSTGV